jgi:5-methylcytosine-specific restriction endonuclease McrA
LQFDHVHGNGELDRQKNRPNVMIRKIANTGQRLASPEIQLLCAPCHRSKSALETVYRAMRGRGIEVETPTRACSALLLRLDAQAFMTAVLDETGSD